MRIVFPDRIDLNETAKKKIQELSIQAYDDTPTDENVIIERIRDADIITVNFIELTRTAIDAAPNLKFTSTRQAKVLQY